MNRLIEFFARQKVFPELITVLVIAAGMVALKNIRREAFPNVNFDIVVVTTIYPGASPKEVENLITTPLEQDLKEITGIKKITSISIEGRSEIVLQLDPDQTTSEEAEPDIQQVVDLFQDLPDGVEEDPFVNVIESKILPVIAVAISTDKSDVELKRISKRVEREIEKISQVAQVSILGDRKYEYRIEMNLSKLRAYEVSFQEVLQVLQKENVTIPAGDYKRVTGGLEKEVVVRTTGEFETKEDILNVVVRSNEVGQPILLKDIANVEFRLADPEKLYRAFKKPALRLVVSKKELADTITLVDELRKTMSSLENEDFMEGVSYGYINDTSYYIRNRLDILSSNLLIGLILILIVLGVFLPFRVAFIVSVGIPFAFLSTIWIFNYNDYSLNLITVMGLIIVVGMLVDDAVVVTENAYRHIEKGLSPLDAAIKGTQEIWLAIFASVLTTILAFFPMAMMTGIFGKFIKFIPLAVIIALIMSLIEAYFVMPSHIALWAQKLDKSKRPAFKVWFEKKWNSVNQGYLRVLKFAIGQRMKYVVVLGFSVFVIASMVVAGMKLKFVLFPPEGVEVFIIKAFAPKGSSLEQTAKLMSIVEDQLEKLPDEEMKNYVVTVGEHKTRDDGADTKRATHYAQAIAYLTPENERTRVANEIIEGLKKDIGQPEGLKILFTRMNPGPPVGSPISVGVRGESMPVIEQALQELFEEVVKWEGVKDLDINYSFGKDEKVIRLNPVETASAGLDTATVGLTIRSIFEGVVPTSIKRVGEEVDVRVSVAEVDRSPRALENVEILNRFGRLVPLKNISSISDSRGLEAIYHEDFTRQFSLLGDVDNKVVTSGEIVEKIKKWLPTISDKYPELEFYFGGEAADTNESLESLKRTFILAVCLIYILLIITFGNFYQPLLILSAIPLGLVSVIWTLVVHNQPISFMALLGTIALAGVIVNNAIVYIDFVNKALKRGDELIDAVLSAGEIRLRPIVLTTSTTVCGLLPTAYGLGGLDKFVVPVALSLGWGLLIGSIMTSFFIPSILVIAETHKNLFNSLLKVLGVLAGLLFFGWFFDLHLYFAQILGL